MLIPNEKIVISGIENIGRRPHQHWLTQIGLTFDTTVVRVIEAVTILDEILADGEGKHPDYPPRVFLNGFNNCHFNLTVLAANEMDPDPARFSPASIDFPSRTPCLADGDPRQLKEQYLKRRHFKLPSKIV